MVKREFTFPSADGKTAIHAVEWLPEDTPRAVLQISHGVAEYVLRYEPFAQYLTERGFAVVGHDHLGHGGSVAEGAPRLYFGPKGSWSWVVADIEQRRKLAHAQFPDLPYFLLGHSMGSFLARTYLIRYPGTVDGAVIMGTGHMAAPVVAAGRALAALECRRVGETQFSALTDKAAFGAYNKPFAPNRTAQDWLSLNTENVDAYIADPNCGGTATVGLFREMLDGIRFITDEKNIRKMNHHTPILFISGAMDPVGEQGKGVERAAAAFRRGGMEDVTVKLYPQLRHEILKEACRETVCGDIGAWLESKMPCAK